MYSLAVGLLHSFPMVLTEIGRRLANDFLTTAEFIPYEVYALTLLPPRHSLTTYPRNLYNRLFLIGIGPCSMIVSPFPTNLEGVSVVILFYDCLLTLGDEIELIWFRVSETTGIWTFLLHRYFSLFAVSQFSDALHTLSKLSCRSSQYVSPILRSSRRWM